VPPERARVVEVLLAHLRTELAAQEAAARMAMDEATSEESKAENQYDTRSLEASYLARGQAERVGALRRLLGFLELPSEPATDRVGLGCLVEVESADTPSWIFLVPREGGRRIHVDGTPVSVLTPQSPLGAALLGAGEGDEIEVERGGKTVVYQVVTVG
jgi:transcription elongation GreA/GreB family factor